MVYFIVNQDTCAFFGAEQAKNDGDRLTQSLRAHLCAASRGGAGKQCHSHTDRLVHKFTPVFPAFIVSLFAVCVLTAVCRKDKWSARRSLSFPHIAVMDY